MTQHESKNPITIVSPPSTSIMEKSAPQRVTLRAFSIGLAATVFIAWFNCWMATKYQVHMIGGIQMPFGALFLLMLFILINLGLKRLTANSSRIPLSPAELLTIYSMTVFGALVSTPGCDNVFLVAGPSLFYFSSPENGWSSLFYKYVPTWFAPGWDGIHTQSKVIAPVYLGQVPFSAIPWGAWTAMLIAWGIFLALVYGLMFFTVLLFRRQWIQSEALAFPLTTVPLQMIDVTDANSTGQPFWSNRLMWLGLVIAVVWHSFFGMHSIFPDWPIAPVNTAGGMSFVLTEYPLNAIPASTAYLYLGATGLAYLLTREVSFSFWFFYLVMSLSYAGAVVVGQPGLLLKNSGVTSRPDFIIYQSVGGWAMMACLLVWPMRSTLFGLVREAMGKNKSEGDEPFSPRFMIGGFLLCSAGLLAWSVFAGINLVVALVFFAIFLSTSLVLARIVIEAGLLFPQPPFLALQTMTGALFGGNLGAANLTKLSFIQPMILVDMRTNVLPAFLHTMKFADGLGLSRRELRRLLLSVVIALIVTVIITVITSLQVLYSQGGLASYAWFARGAGESTFQSTAAAIKNPTGAVSGNWGWIALGAAIVWLMVACRSRFLWFPLHPLGYLVAPSYPLTNLWFPCFCGWLIKTLIMKYGGSTTYAALRPFMIGLILGNATAMLFWTLLVFLLKGTPIPYWPA